MRNLRKYGKPPYRVAVVHGGPGAAGAAAPVARELAKSTGVLEPLQTESSVEGQIAELRKVLEQYAGLPVVLVGHSWGAWLSMFVAARYPSMVKKLILVGSGPLEEKYAQSILATRLIRLSEEERADVFRAIDIINGDVEGDKDNSLASFGELCAKADTYDALPPEPEPEPLAVSEEINRKVWGEAHELRVNGQLLEIAKQVICPVVAIHGDYEPHPAEGVCKPFSRILRDFRFILLDKCGHEPWTERYARVEFFRILRREIG